jgi:hypothetical protein
MTGQSSSSFQAPDSIITLKPTHEVETPTFGEVVGKKGGADLQTDKKILTAQLVQKKLLPHCDLSDSTCVPSQLADPKSGRPIHTGPEVAGPHGPGSSSSTPSTDGSGPRNAEQEGAKTITLSDGRKMTFDPKTLQANDAALEEKYAALLNGVHAPEVVTPAEFKDRSKAILDKLDTNHKGYVTKENLAKAMEDPMFKGKDAQVLAGLYASYDDLTKFSDQPSKGLNKEAMEKYGEHGKQFEKSLDEAAKIGVMADDPAFIKKLDKNGNGFISKEELRKVVFGDNNNLTKEEQAAALNMYLNYDVIAQDHASKGIGTADMKNYQNALWNAPENGAERTIDYVTHRTQESQAVESDKLYGDAKHPVKSIRPDAVKQGLVKDEAFEAALASIAKTNPEQIKKMIKDNHDGTYTVTFPGAPNEPITVKAPTEAERGLYNGGSKDGVWASVMEKAYGAYCQKSVTRRSIANLGGGSTPSEGAQGETSPDGFELMTGNHVKTQMTSFHSQEAVRKEMMEAFNHNPPLAVTSYANIGWPGMDGKTPDGIQRDQAYSVIGFDPNGADGGTVTVRNADGSGGGVKISMKQFMKNFNEVYYESSFDPLNMPH